ncbi:MAG: hypothetical protein M3419_12470 [Actinomycetota bacterium]|nr:hypothetical protein [Actinomycetota bacterium]
MSRFGSWFFAGASLVLLGGLAAPAAADHTDPREPLAPTTGVVSEGIERGDGTWKHIANFPGLSSEALTGGGTDLEFFTPRRSRDIFGSFGTLGQDQAGSIGQRIIRLTANGVVKPSWVADHGSARCDTENASITGLQHDSQITQRGGVRLLIDTTDATGRCHDTGGGGLEIVNVSKMANRSFEPREAHLVRHAGFSHTSTADKQNPGIIYNNAADFSGRNWIDVVDVRSCFGSADWSDAKRRAECRPLVYRINLQPSWTQQRDQSTGQLEPGSATCHDTTYARGRLYCAALNATLILDTSGLFKTNGDVRGTAFPCPVVAGTRTSAKVTDCSGMDAGRTEEAVGWRFLGTFQHPGRDCGPPGTDNRSCNTNLQVRSDDGVSVSHEADPTPDQQFMFVTDERGGGVVPPGSSCAPGIENPYGNGGAHAFDISDPSNIQYATTATGEKSVYISDAVVPAATFCDLHVIEQIPGEQRFIAAYYTQGIKIVDYYVDGQGNLQFEERASFTLPRANTWAAEDFKIRRNGNGTRTYFIAVDDIARGIDVVSWTGRPNPVGTVAPPDSSDTATMNAGLLGGSALLLAGAAAYRRRRLHRTLTDD